jgi:hypothetical protein
MVRQPIRGAAYDDPADGLPRVDGPAAAGTRRPTAAGEGLMGRLFGRLFGPRTLPKVRVHLRGADPSIEGVLWKPYPIDGCYRIVQAGLVEAPDRTMGLDGTIDIPAGNVLFFQRIGDGS